MCRKIPYETKKDAEKMLLHLRNPRRKSKRAEKKPNKKWSTYECPACGKWHLTSMTKREFKQQQKRSRGERE